MEFFLLNTILEKCPSEHNVIYMYPNMVVCVLLNMKAKLIFQVFHSFRIIVIPSV